MQFIPESTIDQKYENIGNAESRSEYIQSLKNKQPAILTYLFSEGFELLTQSEKEYTMFLALVIWESIHSYHPDQRQITPTDIEKAEDENWAKLNESKEKEFREKLNVFFKDSPQEDLLAFIEDALVHDEDDMISNEGREYVFIALKTIIDCISLATA